MHAVNSPDSAPLVSNDGIVYGIAPTGNKTNGVVYALRPIDGSILWKHTLDQHPSTENIDFILAS